MSKRKQKDDYKYLLSKIKKLERQVIHKGTVFSSSDEDDLSSQPLLCLSDNESENSVVAALGPQDWQQQDPQNSEEPLLVDMDTMETDNNHEMAQNEPSTSGTNCSEQKDPEQNETDMPSVVAEEQNTELQLETDVLELLGEDPSKIAKFAPSVHIEIARRFEYIATEGLTKEKRKELTAKYLTPENCPLIGAPGLNPEIKAAMIETSVNRDSGIKSKQTQMASAISCLAEVLTYHLRCKEKNNDMLSKLMDLGRLLCDAQHGDSVVRRNFITRSLKKEMKEHLSNTKIDKLLFSETLSETLKSAKAVSKSGVELKPTSKRAPKKSSPKPLNRQAPAPARRPQGPPRSRAPAAPRAPPPPGAPRPPPPPQPYSKTSSHYQPPTTRSWRR